MHHQQSTEWYMHIYVYVYVYDNETFIQLSHNGWNIIIQIKKSETDEMLKRVHNPFKQIRQATRHIIKEKKISCLSALVVYFLSFFSSHSFFVECQNRRTE